MAEKKELDKYLHRLRKGDELVRLDVCNSLGIIADIDAARLLIKCLDDPSPYVRERAAEWLERIADDQVCSLLIGLLRTEDAARRNQAMTILINLGDMALGRLEKALNDKDEDVRILAATVLGGIGDKRMVGPLLEALNSDENINVRYVAAEALGRIGDPAAVPHLIKTIKNSSYLAYPAIESLGLIAEVDADTEDLLIDFVENDEWLRYPAVEALGNIGSVKAVKAINAQLNNPNTLIQRAALTALAEIEARRHVRALPREKRELSESLARALQDEGAEARRAAVTALGCLAEIEQAERIAPLLDDVDEEVQRAAREALKKIAAKNTDGFLKLLPRLRTEQPEVLTALLGELGRERADSRLTRYMLETLQHSNKRVAAVAARSLGGLGDSRAVAPLIKCLEKPEGNIRRWAAESLGSLGAVEAIQPLVKLLADPYPDVRMSAGRALGEISSRVFSREVAKNIHSERAEIREAAVTAIASMDKQNSEIIIEAFTHPDPKIRVNAVMMIKERNPRLVSDLLVKSLLDEEWQVRKVAAEALGETLPALGVEPLINLLADENMWVRYAAAASLKYISSLSIDERDKAISKLVELLENDEDCVKLAVLESLAEIGEPATLPAVIKAAGSNNEDVRRAAALTLGAFPDDDALSKLRDLAADEVSLVSEAAATTLAKVGAGRGRGGGKKPDG